MRVGDHQLDTAQAPPCELAQELGPDRLGFGSAYFHSQNFAATIRVHPDRDDDGDRDDAPATPDLEVGGVDPEIGPVALDWPIKEGFHLAVGGVSKLCLFVLCSDAPVR